MSGLSPSWRQRIGWLDDVVLVLLIALLFPVVILLIGTPFALLIDLLLTTARRFFG